MSLRDFASLDSLPFEHRVAHVVQSIVVKGLQRQSWLVVMVPLAAIVSPQAIKNT